MSLYTVQDDQLLDLVRFINQRVSEGVVLDSFIHELDRIPVLVIAKDHWLDVARLIRDDISMSFTYLRNISGVDYETHMQVVYQVYSFLHDKQLHIKIDLDREKPEVASVADIWQAANWNEREMFDLLGIHFTGHPNLKRILMPDDWVGYPLRKDYEQFDQGV